MLKYSSSVSLPRRSRGRARTIITLAMMTTGEITRLYWKTNWLSDTKLLIKSAVAALGKHLNALTIKNTKWWLSRLLETRKGFSTRQEWNSKFWSTSKIETRTTTITLFESSTTKSLEDICSSRLNCLAWTCMSSSSPTTSKEFQLGWSGGLLFKFFKRWSSNETTTSFIVIWSRKTSYWSSRTSQALKSSTTDLPAFRINESTRTFKVDSIELLKLFLEFLTLQQLTCGVSDV